MEHKNVLQFQAVHQLVHLKPLSFAMAESDI